jgi:adenosylhomocysteine nucleosidase
MKVILFVALENEFPAELAPKGVKVVYTGVGKINAAMKVTEELYEYHPSDTIVINFGSAGSTLPKLQMYKCSKFTQADMDAEPFAPKTETPFDPNGKQIVFRQNGYECYTQDRFETNPKEGFIYDMEAYSIAKVCRHFGFDFHCYKFVSDDGNVDDWETNHNKGIQLFLEELKTLPSPDGGTVDTSVLGTDTERCESSSLS